MRFQVELPQGVHDRRAATDPLAHLSKLNVSTDRRHDRRVLTPEEFGLLIEAAETGPHIEMIPGPDRAIMYIFAGWTGFRKGEVGSPTPRSLRLDDDPPTATVAACYSKRRRQDTQILHPEVVRLLKEWLATKPDLGPDDLLFPVSGKVPGGTERKTHKMMRLDLERARTKWIEEAGDDHDPGEKRCPLWCPLVPNMVSNASHRMRYRLHQFALGRPTGPRETATRRSPQVPTKPGHIAPIRSNLHRSASSRGPVGWKYPREDSNL